MLGKIKQRAQNILALERLRIQREFNEELERQAIIKAPVDELNKLMILYFKLIL